MDHLRSCLASGLEVGGTAVEGAITNPCPLQQVGNDLTLMIGLLAAGMSIGDLCVMAPDLLAEGAAPGNRYPNSTSPPGRPAEVGGMDIDPANTDPSGRTRMSTPVSRCTLGLWWSMLSHSPRLRRAVRVPGGDH